MLILLYYISGDRRTDDWNTHKSGYQTSSRREPTKRKLHDKLCAQVQCCYFIQLHFIVEFRSVCILLVRLTRVVERISIRIKEWSTYLRVMIIQPGKVCRNYSCIERVHSWHISPRIICFQTSVGSHALRILITVALQGLSYKARKGAARGNWRCYCLAEKQVISALQLTL